LQQVVARLPHRAGPDRPVEVGVGRRQPLGQPPEVGLEVLPHHRPGSRGQPVLLGRRHPEQLPPAVEQLGQGAGAGVREGPDRGPDGLGEVGQDGGVEGVRLGRPAGRLGEPPGLGRVDDGGRHPGRVEGHDGRVLEAAGGLDHDERRGHPADPGDEGGDPGRVVGEPLGAAGRSGVGVEEVLGHVDADERGGVHRSPRGGPPAGARPGDPASGAT